MLILHSSFVHATHRSYGFAYMHTFAQNLNNSPYVCVCVIDAHQKIFFFFLGITINAHRISEGLRKVNQGMKINYKKKN